MRVLHTDPGAARQLALCFAGNVLAHPYRNERILVVCIGTDRSTGDSLGPLVGSRLLESCPPNIEVFGSLDEPVHAANLSDVISDLNRRFSQSLVLAVDACLGQNDQVGTISFSMGPVRPGAGVNKILPAVGQMHITGTVNVGGFMEYVVLQNTRLSLVVRMAKTIAEAVLEGVRIVQIRKEATSRLPGTVLAQ